VLNEKLSTCRAGRLYTIPPRDKVVVNLTGNFLGVTDRDG
jgi:hypothetical protein